MPLATFSVVHPSTVTTPDPAGVAILPSNRRAALEQPQHPAPGQDRREHVRSMFHELAGLTPDTTEHHDLRDRLVEVHLPLVRYFARRYAGRGEPLDDLLQAGALGLVKAVDRFDPERGLEFSSFAAPTILGEIRRHFRDHTWAVHVHRTLQELTGQVARSAAQLSQELHRAPTVAELAERLGLPVERVLESLDCAAAYTAESLETPTGEDRRLGDQLGDDDAAYDHVDIRESLGPALARLPEREQRILQLRFYGNMTQSQIAARLGISQMHVSRLLGRSLGRLRQELTADG